MKKILISSGCSQAWGYGLPDRSRRYAQVIADTCDMELVDVSRNGYSNDAISYRTVAAINQALLTHSADNIIVLVGWTTQDRVDVHDRTTLRYRRLHVHLENMPGARHYNDKNVAVAKVVRDNVWTESLGFLKHLHAINYVMMSCALRGIRCVQVCNLDAWVVPFPKLLFQQHEHDQTIFTDINRVIAPEFRSTVRGLFKRRSLYDITSADAKKYHNNEGDAHANARGHSMWAQKIIDENPEIFK